MGADFNLKPSLFGLHFLATDLAGECLDNGERDETAFVAAERETEDARNEKHTLRAIERRPLG